MMDWRLVDWFGRRVPAEWKKRWVRALPDAGGQWVPDPPPGAAVVVLAYRPVDIISGIAVDVTEYHLAPADKLVLVLPEGSESTHWIGVRWQPTAGVDRAAG